MQLEVVRNFVGAAAFDALYNELRDNGLPIYRAVRTIAREFNVPRNIHKTRSRFAANLGEDPFGKRQKPDPVVQALDFADPIVAPIMNGDDVNFRRTKVTIGGTKKRTANDLFKAEIGSMDELIFRWQACSSNLLGPGRVPIGFGYSTPNTSLKCLPIYMMSLTTHPGFPTNVGLGCHNDGMFRIFYRAVPATSPGFMGYSFFPSTNAVGNTVITEVGWDTEKGNEPENAHANTNQVFHKYTDIRLNLYGSALYPLKYRVMLMTGLPEEMQPLEHAVISNASYAASQFPIAPNNSLNQFIFDHVRPLVTNPIIGANTASNYKELDYKVLSDKTYTIPCLSYGNAAAEGSSAVNSTNVRNVNMFVRHDRFRDYQWKQKDSNITRQNDPGGIGFNQTDIASRDVDTKYCDVDREQRVFLVITCNAGKEVVNPVYDAKGPIFGPLVDGASSYESHGSYDIVVRNCFRQDRNIV